MKFGMLWFDDDPQRLLSEKVRRAVEAFRTRYGRQATTCVVSPDLVDEGQPLTTGMVRVRANRSVVKGEFWLGEGTGEGEPAQDTGSDGRG